MLADVPAWVRLLSAGTLIYAALLGLWPAWITPGGSFLFFLLLLPLFAALCISILVTLISLLWDWHKQRIARHAWLTPVLLLAATALVLPSLWISIHARQLATAVAVDGWMKQHAQQPVAGWAAGRLGLEVFIETGPPVRAAFMTDPGFLDNWSGIVFDPTGKVMQADGWDASGKFRAPEVITKLFDGDLDSCRHLWGAYYHCGFT
jgi:hypothetical protein